MRRTGVPLEGFWPRLRNQVHTFADLRPELVGAVEQLRLLDRGRRGRQGLQGQRQGRPVARDLHPRGRVRQGASPRSRNEAQRPRHDEDRAGGRRGDRARRRSSASATTSRSTSTAATTSRPRATSSITSTRSSATATRSPRSRRSGSASATPTASRSTATSTRSLILAITVIVISFIRMLSDGPRGVLERVADGVADDGGLVRVGALAAVAPASMYFLALSQAPPALAMKMRQHDAGDQRAGEQAAERLDADERRRRAATTMTRTPGTTIRLQRGRRWRSRRRGRSPGLRRPCLRAGPGSRGTGGAPPRSSRWRPPTAIIVSAVKRKGSTPPRSRPTKTSTSASRGRDRASWTALARVRKRRTAPAP